VVRFVIPFPVGGSSDANARIIGPHLSERRKQRVIVDPCPGAATVVGRTTSPGGTPKELLARIREDLVAVLQIPDARQRPLDIGGNPSGEPTEEFAARVKNENAKWQKVAKAAGIPPQ
jgi:tripartite-type tricarboxylate transporter receptor subunit TctC